MSESVGRDTSAEDQSRSDPVVVISCDGHAGPRLREDLRAYCPTAIRDAFDEFWRDAEAQYRSLLRPENDSDDARLARRFAGHPNMAARGHFDPGARLEDMDTDGVGAELIWHFSQNGQPLPFAGHGLGTVTPEQFKMAGAGYLLYNRWLADFCATDAARLLGVMYLPLWDIDASIEEMEYLRGRGLGVVNFPPPGRPGMKEYNDRAWDRFWSACEDLDVVLATHSSGGPLFNYDAGPGGRQILAYEGGGWLARRSVWWLIYGGVFARHPTLRLVITEQYEGWWVPTSYELDSVYVTFGVDDSLPRRPSEYLRSNVYLGASFISREQAEEASRHGYAQNVLWGRDYPHVEGLWRPATAVDGSSITRLALSFAFADVPAEDAVGMIGLNALGVYGLDGAYLTEVAQRIGAPTPAELAVRPEVLPDVDRSCAFLGQAGPRPLEPERMRRFGAGAHDALRSGGRLGRT